MITSLIKFQFILIKFASLFQIAALYKFKPIRQLGALLLLLLFVMSNTPEQWVHNLFATHTDGKKACADIVESKKTANIIQLRFHCQCDHIVVESPFIYQVTAFVVSNPYHYFQFSSALYSFLTPGPLFQVGLRGPPVA